MIETLSLFVTQLHRALLPGAAALNVELEAACRSIAREDKAGRAWCAEKNYPGYTSYASLDDLPRRSPAFAELAAGLDPLVAAFGKAADFDLGRAKLKLDAMWINVLKQGGGHSGHIHPHSVVSGTYYVAVPEGASALKLEDPRLDRMMAAPPRRAEAAAENRTFVYVAPKAGEALLWESWLRHEVPPSAAAGERISVSFNYSWR